MAPWRRLVLAVFAVVAVSATVVAEREAAANADDRQVALATEAAVVIEGSTSASASALAGAGGLVDDDGTVELGGFRTYAREVVEVSPIDVVALVSVVPHADRAGFEGTTGGPIVDQRDGRPVPASTRSLYYPVAAVEPIAGRARAIGFDLLGEPVLSPAAIRARDTGTTTLTAPVASAVDGEPSYVLVKPLYRPGAAPRSEADRRRAHAGFVATVNAGSQLAAALADRLPAGSRFSLRDGPDLLAGSSESPSGGFRRTVEAGDRQWTLVVEDGRGVDQTLPLSAAAFAGLLGVGMLLFFRRAARHDVEMQRSALVIGRTADVAQALAAAGTVEEVVEVIGHQVPGVLGATSASLGVVDRDAGVLRVSASPRIDRAIAERWSSVPLDAEVPLAKVVRTGEPLLLQRHADWVEHSSPAVLADLPRIGLVSAACLPLGDRFGAVQSTLAISWDREVDFDAPTRDTLRTITELCEYTLDRARSTDTAASAALQLAKLAGLLASAVNVAQVLEVITDSASSPVGASATSVGLIDREAGVLRTHHGRTVSDDVRARFTDPPLDAPLAFTDAARTGEAVLLGDHAAFSARYPESSASTSGLGFGARAALPMRGSDGSVVGAIVHAWPGPRVFDETLVSTLLTIADMAAQALERTGLSEAEHRLVTSLQDSLLLPLPPAAHLDIAARYVPSVADIGMGGDWYEGIAIDDHRYALIVGDVAGHGITAVADMAQLRAVVGSLVRLELPLGQVFPQATTLLLSVDHAATATCLLLVVDTERDVVTYVAAGHPPAALRRPDGGVMSLGGGRQPLLGVAFDAADTAEHPFPRGSVMVAYTDGLIERRGEPIDRSIARLHTHLAAAPGDASGIADHLLARCLDGDDPTDDVAVVVIGRRA